MSAILYARVSTDRQETDGTSLDAQVAELERVAALEGVPVRGVFKGAESGKLEMAARPTLMAAMGAVEPGDVFYVTKVDRLSRSVFVGEGIIRALKGLGATVRILEVSGDDADPQVIFLRQVLAAAAELERANIVARTMAGKMRAVARGGRWGGAGFGVRGAAGGGLEPCPEEQDTLRAVRAALEAGSTWRHIRETVPGRTRVDKDGKAVRGQVSFQVISRVQKQMDEEAEHENF
jgi:DNA invertase Pin-like site-specific DNA recombinase